LKLQRATRRKYKEAVIWSPEESNNTEIWHGFELRRNYMGIRPHLSLKLSIRIIIECAKAFDIVHITTDSRTNISVSKVWNQ